MSGRARVEALRLAEDLLVQGHTYRSAIDGVQQKFLVSERTAKRVLAELYTCWRAESEQDRPHRREEQRRRVLSLYRAARAAGRYATAAGLEALLMKLDRTAQPEVHVFEQASRRSDSFEGRTSEDLLYYAQHGYFPEDAPRGASSPTDPPTEPTRFPLD